MEGNSKGVKELFSEVIDEGLCTLCGACSGGCPYLVPYKGRIVLIDSCTVEESQCYKYCPRTYLDMDAISQQVFNTPYSHDELGTTQNVVIARSTDPDFISKGQYGGVVTTLLSLAVDEGLIDQALLTRMNGERVPEPFLAQNKADILSCAGSSYMSCPVLSEFNLLSPENSYSLGVVGVPCQVQALTKMKVAQPKNRVNMDSVKLVIGLFCTWALSQSAFQPFLNENLNISHIKKFDIPPPPANVFDAYTDTGKVSFSLDQIRNFTMPACAYCLDMTAEFADISVGSVEGIEGWNTVIVRTDTGTRLIEKAKKSGKLEIDTLPEENLAHLKEASLNKKKRGLKTIVDKTNDKNNLLYMGLSNNYKDSLLG